MMHARRLTLVVFATLCTLAGGLAIAGVSAFAKKVYVPGPSFGSEGSGSGQFKEPTSVAVNDSLVEANAGDVYVVDRGNHRVEWLTLNLTTNHYEYAGQSNGTSTPAGGFSELEGIAIDNSGKTVLEDPSVGDLYVADSGTGHNVIDQFTSTGNYVGQITNGACAPTNSKMREEACPPGTTIPFARIYSVAADPSGDLWVSYKTPAIEKPGVFFYEYNASEFSDKGTLIKTCEVGETETTGVAIDSHEDVYLGEENAIDQIAGGTCGENWLDFFGSSAHVSSLAINPSSNNLLVDEVGSVVLYGPFGEPFSTVEGNRVNLAPIESFPREGWSESLSESYGLTVNSAGTAYASERGADKVETFDYLSLPTVTTEAASGVTATGMTLHGTVDPENEPVSECYFEYGAKAGVYTNKIACEPAPGEGVGQIGKGTVPVSVSAPLSGLPPAGVRSFRLVAANANGVADGQGVAISRPVLLGEAVSGVGSVVATAGAQVDAGGLATCYFVEYGTSTAYDTSTPEECVGGSSEDVGVHAELSGLQPDTAYHFRIVASNALGTTFGGDVTFTTFAPPASGLPDGRVYELVSPVGAGLEMEVYVPNGMVGEIDSNGQHGIYTGLPYGVSADGEAVAYVGDPPTVGGNGDIGDGGGNQYLAERGPQGGWTQADLNAPGPGNDYSAFSGDLSVGILTSSEQLAADAPAGYTNLYAHATTGGSSGPFEPVVTSEPPNRLPANFGAVLDGQFDNGLIFGGGNAGTSTVSAFSHLLFEANAALTPNAVDGGELENNLYDSVGGRLYLVNVLPDGETEANATFGRQGPSTNGFRSVETSNVISADGSRIFWSAVKAVKVGTEYEERPEELYVRENDTQPQSPVEDGECLVPADACTVQVDVAAAGAKGPSGGGQFWTASGDGSKVFFTDEHQLTTDSTAESGESDLYEYDLEAPEGERLSDLSAGAKAGSHADVQGVVGTSEDGSYVYFVADGVLSEGENAEEREPVAGQPNLYLRHAGVTTFVATLASEDGDFTKGTGGNDGDWQADPGQRTAEVTPGGHSLVFMSRQSLTAYDNILEGRRLTEVFVYNADAGRLACASCNPSGEPPVENAFAGTPENGDEIWGSFLPISNSVADYQPRVISQDGDRVFFDSIEPLVPQDTNGLLDVYEWERAGTGSCQEPKGCIYLLSGGQSTDNSYLLDASASGDDVFIVTRAQLLEEDRSDYDVLYDARVGGVSPPVEAACSGTGCQGVPPAPPIFATPSSVTFNGIGNFPAPVPAVQKKTKKKASKCAKGKKLSHGKCVKAKAKGKRKAKARKSGKAKAKNSVQRKATRSDRGSRS